MLCQRERLWKLAIENSIHTRAENTGNIATRRSKLYWSITRLQYLASPTSMNVQSMTCSRTKSKQKHIHYKLCMDQECGPKPQCAASAQCTDAANPDITAIVTCLSSYLIHPQFGRLACSEINKQTRSTIQHWPHLQTCLGSLNHAAAEHPAYIAAAEHPAYIAPRTYTVLSHRPPLFVKTLRMPKP